MGIILFVKHYVNALNARRSPTSAPPEVNRRGGDNPSALADALWACSMQGHVPYVTVDIVHSLPLHPFASIGQTPLSAQPHSMWITLDIHIRLSHLMCRARMVQHSEYINGEVPVCFS